MYEWITWNVNLAFQVIGEREWQIRGGAILTGNGGLHVATQCGVFKGTAKEIFVDRREYTGPLWEQIDEAFQFVLRNIHLGAAFAGIYRQDIYEIPPDAIRELIVNATVHRSYLDHGTIQVAVYDNRLEITSPGKLPMGQTLERMKEGYSKIRNEADPYLETREKEDAFLERVETAIRDGVKESVPMAMAKNLLEMFTPFVKESVGGSSLPDRTLSMEKPDDEIMEDNLDWEKEADMDTALDFADSF